ncbi:MAG: energy-coupling factor transporter transmembrane component T [Sulfitobacter sp.]
MISLTSPVETRAHGWSAGGKLMGLAAATLLLFGVQNLMWQAAFLLGTVTLYALPGRVFLRSGLGRIWGLWPFVAVILVWHMVTGDGWGGALVVIRMLTAVALANLVTMTTRLSDMMGVVHGLMTPLRRIGLRTQGIEVAMALVVRFTPVLVAKGRALTMAWRARSARRPGWRIILPFAVTAIDDAEHVAQALRARGGL